MDNLIKASIDSKMQTNSVSDDAREVTHRNFPLPAGAVMTVQPIDVSPQPGCGQDKGWMVLARCQLIGRQKYDVNGTAVMRNVRDR